MILLLTLLGSLLHSCDKKEETTCLSGEVISYSDCKSKALGVDDTPDTLSCVNYTYDAANQTLSVTHINAGFNCCPGTLSCTVVKDGSALVIQEEETYAQCDCNCLFDLEIEIEGLAPGSYTLSFEEPYAADLTALVLELDLNEEASGSSCVVRKAYPWGM